MNLWARLKELRRYPSAVIGLVVVGLLVLMSIYALIRYPYSEAIRLWRAGELTWIENPRNAAPFWYNWFGVDLPTTVKVGPEQARVVLEENLGGGTRRRVLLLGFDYPWRKGFPQELALFYEGTFTRTPPQAVLTWRTPDGREIPLGTQTLRGSGRYLISGDSAVAKRVGTEPRVGLFRDPWGGADGEGKARALPGRYELWVDLYLFEPESTVSLKLVVYGQLHGWAGTDHLRRDITIALLWGGPIAIAFGMSAALILTLWYLTISAIGAWFGGWVDALIDRLTELRMILPTLPILIMVGMFWSRSIWLILAVIILLGLIGGSKGYRAMYLQARSFPYIEAARAYGAGSMRIILRYLVPRFLPLVIPAFVSAIPSYVFLEASLAILGLGDPLLPTWGKVIQDAYSRGALFLGYYYWILIPGALLLITGMGFAFVGFALDRIFNPRLRSL
ncbi:MAG: ABC transporter permease [Candidatus Bipolaricaulaceae bacterium]